MSLLALAAPAAADSFPPEFELSDLDGANGFTLKGFSEYDNSGSAVSEAGDVNGDGIDDLIIGAHNAKPNGISYAGQSYVVFGNDQGFPAELELSSLDGTTGFALNGIDERDNSGWSVSQTGDVNGDGIDDIIIGTRYADPNGVNYAGRSYVVFGSDQGFPAALELSDLNGTNGFALNGINEDDRSGNSVSGAGDLNGDGVNDVIIGAEKADPNGDRSGQSYVVFGSDQGSPAALELSDLNGTNGFALNGINEGDRSGNSVSEAGDLNGDGVNDVIIGASGADPNGDRSGQSYVVFGSDQGFPATLELSSLDGANGFALNGIDEQDYSGRSVSGAGDVNGDGIDDVIIGAIRANPNGVKPGQSYVVFGSDQGFPAALELSSLNGTNGFALNGVHLNGRSGFSVSGAGDVNGDGIDDIITGAPLVYYGNGLYYAGQSYVLFGTNQNLPASVQVSDLDGNNGFTLKGISEGDLSGVSVSGAGDVNGDGIDDVVIGAPVDDALRSSPGQSYVIFGKEPFGGALSGTFVAFAGCLNLGTGQFAAATVNPDNVSWNCETAGLDFVSGDTVASVGIGLAQPVLGSVGGSVKGATPIAGICNNMTQGPPQVLAPVPPGETAWNCEAAGLPVNPGDIVQVIGVGTAD